MPNRLINEQSPYLLQHAHNPVDWFPWCDEAFKRAESENKPILISIGYAACHWCHVMERESFEDVKVAAFMNEHFICIKVDKEEHPDVDHLYMDAVQAMTGSGGWPLNVFVTPDKAPYYGGTYFPPRAAYNRPSWTQILYRMAEIWEDQPDEAIRQGIQMLSHLQQTSIIADTQNKIDYNWDTCRKIAENLLKQADKMNGGFGNAPKFPGTMAISFLLEHYHFTGYEPALKQALLSLDKMAKGGIYDQIGGGFARYATDTNWLIPHFEKMLYDNALLISAYCDAYSITKNKEYKSIIKNTIAFIERELKDESGIYYCAIDADSEGVEGKFYTYTWQEWCETVGADNNIAAAYFGITENGNWEHTNIVHVKKSIEEIAKENNCDVAEVVAKIEEAKKKIFSKRSERIRPITDNKSLLSWNALLNISYAKAGIALEDNSYIEVAEKHMELLLQLFLKDGKLNHVWKKGVPKISANLDDYAYLVQALLRLSNASGNLKWINKAKEFLDKIVIGFKNNQDFFYFTPEFENKIPVRKVEIYDGATPAANSVMVDNLFVCGLCTENTVWIEQAKKMTEKMIDSTIRYSYSFGNWAINFQRQIAGIKTIVCASANANTIGKEIRKIYMPEVFLLTSEKEIFEIQVMKNKFFSDKVSIFVCSENACMSPLETVTDVLKQIEQMRICNK